MNYVHYRKLKSRIPAFINNFKIVKKDSQYIFLRARFLPFMIFRVKTFDFPYLFSVR
jgi:hypothetical protein